MIPNAFEYHAPTSVDGVVTVSELGTIIATSRPYVVLTSNGTRELSDALRRRCLHHYVEYPDFDKELRIVNARVPEIGPGLARQVVEFVQALRTSNLRKSPGIAETLDWAAALLRLDVKSLDQDPDAAAASAAPDPDHGRQPLDGHVKLRFPALRPRWRSLGVKVTCASIASPGATLRRTVGVQNDSRILTLVQECNHAVERRRSRTGNGTEGEG